MRNFVPIFICIFVSMTRQEDALKSSEKLTEITRNLIQKKVESKGNFRLEDNQAIIDEYVDKLFEYIKEYITLNNMDSIDLPNTTLNILTGHCDLSEGHLTGISTLSRTDDAVVSYSSDNEQLTVILPIEFQDLAFNYVYHTEVTIIKIDGGAEGSINNPQFHIQLSFSFISNAFTLDHFDMKDTGKIKVKFTGNGLVDWLTNAMTTAVTTILHPLIVKELQKVVGNNLNSLIEQLNEIIHNILYPTTVINL